MFNKKALIWGGIFGFFAPIIGLFIGLQVSTTVANILMFPIIAMSAISGSPFGTWGSAALILAVIVSIVVWALVFALVYKAYGAFRSPHSDMMQQ